MDEWKAWPEASPPTFLFYACPICGAALLKVAWIADPRQVHWNWHVRQGRVVPGA
jgi:hypothetical protein